MKFPSIKNLALSAKNTFQRFPFELLFALAGTIAATANIELNNTHREAESWCTRVVMIANLGLLLNLSATLLVESRAITGSKKWGIKAVAIIIAILLLFLLKPEEQQADWVRFFLLSLALHLLVAYTAFTNKGHIQGFWQFNKTLFLRFLTSALYGAVLYGGLAAAIGAMNLLFNFKFEWDTFSILWVWIVGMFSTTFFLAGVPSNYTELDADTTYPKGLKVFTQYVLIPLATIYVIILLAYGTKILIQWNLPKGYVSNLILGYAVFGILSLLLVYPIREKEENKWLKTYARSFYFLLMPLLMLLFVAVGARVFKYGITEQRYFLILLAVWLLFISIYFLVFKKQNIKLIPISLSIVTLLSVYGPLSAFSVSAYSQTRILISIFKRNDAFKQGKLIAIKKIDSANGVEAAEKLEYLVAQHDLQVLQPYVVKDLTLVSDSLAKKKGVYSNSFTINRYELRSEKQAWISSYLGLKEYSNRGVDIPAVVNTGYHFFNKDHIINVKNYDYMIDVNDVDTTLIQYDNISFKADEPVNNKFFILKIDKEIFTFKVDELTGALLTNKTINRYRSKKETYEQTYHLPAPLLTITRQNKNYKVELLIENVIFNRVGKVTEPTYASGIYLIKKLH